jgi:hypothetical protein
VTDSEASHIASDAADGNGSAEPQEPDDETSGTVCVFAPAPQLTITIEGTVDDRAELHGERSVLLEIPAAVLDRHERRPHHPDETLRRLGAAVGGGRAAGLRRLAVAAGASGVTRHGVATDGRRMVETPRDRVEIRKIRGGRRPGGTAVVSRS